MFETVLVANRGEIARRVVRTLRRLDIKSVAVHSSADAYLPFVREADDAVLLGPPPPAESYLDIDRVLEAAYRSGAEAVHPGYGFLSESAEFAGRVTDAGFAWVGPPPDAMRAMADKVDARATAAAAGVPVAPGTEEPLTDVEDAAAAAKVLGYPLMVKASAGGGGIGMAAVEDETGLRAAFATAQQRARRFFGSASVLLERYLPRARHVEVQVLGLADGSVVTLGERDCSVQRRHQKVVEEAPAPAVAPALRERLAAAAVAVASAVGYRNAGTVEFLVSGEDFVFLEMNTRLQVEHPVTEMVTGLDLVEEQLRVAAGEPATFDAPPEAQGHAVEMRVYAEDPARFLPSPGKIRSYREPAGPGVRVDSGYAKGDTVSPHYDPLIAKVCAFGADRAEAVARAREAVAAYEIEGPRVNLPFLAEVLADEGFASGTYDTGLVGRMRG